MIVEGHYQPNGVGFPQCLRWEVVDGPNKGKRSEIPRIVDVTLDESKMPMMTEGVRREIKKRLIAEMNIRRGLEP